MFIFEPLHFLSNLLIPKKILLQVIWDSGINWDDQITDKQFEIHCLKLLISKFQGL